ncbi:MAG: preprotein translocase subunit SecY [Pseudomonadota bacterium]|nr:preprotein translocase subunit SecY [Gammaproteobacteria bacterium]MEE2684130.1 preprotein translocase subunit SecY [Pseudomonadota bacterium]|tara:strand:- start:8404 stop:9729 length:1326 start_codon:yes stop_codon:yes gene_type:complete
MANSNPANPATILGDASRFSELRQRIFFLLGALIVYRIGTFIPVPGIDPLALEQFFEQQSGTILSMFNMFSGGALSRLSIFALGIMPYISASIIMQMATHVVPSLGQLRKEGESGRRKITQYTRYGTVILSSFQSMAAATALQNQNVVINPGTGFVLTAAVTLVTGTMFLMWLGEQITERGIGNGISMIILASIISGLPSAIGGTLELVSNGGMNQAMPFILGILLLGVTSFVVYMERAQRRIAVNYAKRQQGRRMYAGQTSHLPFKINMSGVIPPIFASSLILFPATIASWFGTSQSVSWLQLVAARLSPGQPLYIAIYAGLIMFFCFFYTSLVFNAKETADNLKKSGAFIPGVRPGQQTAEYIDKVLTKLTFWGAIYITAVCLLPEFMILNFNIPFYFGGTSLLIIVVVTMDFMSQLQAHMMSHQYEGLLKKANLHGVR